LHEQPNKGKPSLDLPEEVTQALTVSRSIAYISGLRLGSWWPEATDFKRLVGFSWKKAEHAACRFLFLRKISDSTTGDGWNDGDFIFA
jgi:hypothetical protein